MNSYIQNPTHNNYSSWGKQVTLALTHQKKMGVILQQLSHNYKKVQIEIKALLISNLMMCTMVKRLMQLVILPLIIMATVY